MSKKKKSPAKCAPRCPYCGAISYLRSAEGIYIDNSKNAMLYVCKNYPACDAYVRVHPGTTIPMGTLANRKVRALRAEAHKYFNKIYLRGIMSREDAYEWLKTRDLATTDSERRGTLYDKGYTDDEINYAIEKMKQ